MLTIGLITVALSLIIPQKVGDGGYIDRRSPLMATYLLLAGAQPELFPRRSRQCAVTAVFFGLAAARTMWIASIWLAREADVRAIQMALNKAPEGAAILEVQSEPAIVQSARIGRFLPVAPASQSQTTLVHVPVMAIAWRKAFVPTLFAVPGQQPIKVLPPWSELKSQSLEPPDIHVLDTQGPSDLSQPFAYLRDWSKNFDYVLAIGMDEEDFQGPFTPSSTLSVVADEGYARLYRIDR